MESELNGTSEVKADNEIKEAKLEGEVEEVVHVPNEVKGEDEAKEAKELDNDVKKE